MSSTGDSSALRSRIYECRILHERFAPRRHRFAYRAFYLALDLDEWGALGRRVGLLGSNRRGVVSVHESDYLPLHEAVHNPDGIAPLPTDRSVPLKERVRILCARHGVELAATDRVALITLPRILGYAFNPISLFVCRAADGTPRCALAEVTNTYHEVKQYFLPWDPAAGEFAATQPKHFYVSPFSPLDATFAFRLRDPGERLALAIDDHESGRRTLHSTLTGEARPLTTGALASCLLRHPLVTLRVITLIHWQALRLWLKRVPHHPKAAHPESQRNLRHPHASLVQRSPA